MHIDLVYYFRNVNNFYYLNGPEKVNGNIVNNSPAYQLSSANDVVTRINQMIASLAPDITNVGIVTSELYIGDIQVNTYRGDLNLSSYVPDYTDILSSINENLTNLNNKLIANNYSLADIFTKFFYLFSPNDINSNITTVRNNSYFRNALFINGDYRPNYSIVRIIDSCLTSIYNMLRQSVSPNASITDILSSLNTNIHNDLTNINATAENKDNVLIIDGQQTFKIRNSDEEI